MFLLDLLVFMEDGIISQTVVISYKKLYVGELGTIQKRVTVIIRGSQNFTTYGISISISSLLKMLWAYLFQITEVWL